MFKRFKYILRLKHIFKFMYFAKQNCLKRDSLMIAWFRYFKMSVGGRSLY